MMIRGIPAWLLAMVLFASAADAHGGVGMRQFPFSVGQTLGKSMGIYTAMVVVVVAVVYLLWHLGRKQKPVPA
jgi:succinate dehydrogenase/fumarate reductase cytochrome b subunit